MSNPTFGEKFMTYLVVLLAVAVTSKSSTNFEKSYSAIDRVTASRAVALQAELVVQSSSKPMTISAQQLMNTAWLLESLDGTSVLKGVQTTIRFNGMNHISGQGGCNFYNAKAQLNGNRLTVGAVASTKKLCAPAVMNQENRYFQAIQNARRVSLEGKYLLIYSDGMNTPLQFTRLNYIREQS
ncbi:MAG: META domain-containing protein [Chroococcidiopsidaceae cyanobacterium CP_BM_ER_R8_30]|nr:META domain-containing protein [Chroococcidiopsidaceae cyanobacterium CP_BM_ER_R8_30]